MVKEDINNLKVILKTLEPNTKLHTSLQNTIKVLDNNPIFENASNYLANNYSDVEKIIGELRKIKDKSIQLDTATTTIKVWGAFKNKFTVEEFLKIISE